jgi:hypothetical protein
MQTLRVGRGYSADWDVTLRDADGIPVEDVYAGSETLALVVCDDLGASLTLTGSTVAWLDAPAGTIRLHLDDSDTTALGPLPRGLSIVLTAAGEPIEVYRATLRVEPRAT